MKKKPTSVNGITTNTSMYDSFCIGSRYMKTAITKATIMCAKIFSLSKLVKIISSI